MPARKMCASCVCHARDHTAIVFKKGPSRPDFHQAEAIELPGTYCKTAAWQAVLNTMQASTEYIGGEVRRASAFAPLPIQ